MRVLSLRSAAVVLGLALFAHPAAAQRNDDSDARIVARQPLHHAASAIETRNGEVALLLVNRAIVVQLTDHGLGKVGREMNQDAREEQGAFARFVGGIVRSGVQQLLDHGIEVPLAELREARYEDGRLRLIGRDGDELFENMQINDVEVMESFSPAEARAFAARVNQARRRAEL